MSENNEDVIDEEHNANAHNVPDLASPEKIIKQIQYCKDSLSTLYSQVGNSITFAKRTRSQSLVTGPKTRTELILELTDISSEFAKQRKSKI